MDEIEKPKEESMPICISVSDGFKEAIKSLSDSPKSAHQIIHRFLDSGQPIAELSCIDRDRTAAVTKYFRIVLEPSDALRELLVAVRAFEIDGG